MTVTEFEKRAAYQNGYDREIDHWQIIDIHQIPLVFTENHEMDFYCSNGKEVYLLRCRYRKTESYERIDAKSTEGISFLIAEFPIQKIDNKTIGKILKKFKTNL